MKQARDIIRLLFDEKDAIKADRWHSFFSGWRNAVGDDLAAHSRVIDIRSGTVVVEVDHPGWLQMVRLKERQIIRTLKNRYPELGLTSLSIFSNGTNSGIETSKQTDKMPLAPNEEEIHRMRGVESAEYREFHKLLERMKTLGDDEHP